MLISRLLRLTLAAAGLALPLSAASAQQNPGYFVPPSAQQARPPQQRVQQPPPQQRRAPTQQLAPDAGPGPGPEQADQGPPMQLQLPPMPALPAIAKGAAPPAAVVGVLGIPEIMRASTAAQQVERVIGERREKLNADAQKEQIVWREMQQALANDRSKLSADQIRAKEKELQDRITSAQRTFRDRNRIIQQAGQYGLAQIERLLVSVIRQVAESRGMNLVLYRAQVALNVQEFDITDQVTEQLNKQLPTVNLPADGVAPPMIAVATPPQPGAAANQPGAPAPQPASATPSPSTPAPAKP